MKVIITGGGTGGHIIPALAILDILKENYVDLSVLYIGSKDSLEEELSQKAGYDFKGIKTGYINRKLLSIHNIKSLFNNSIGVLQSLGIIRKFSPDLIIGTGGYVSGPVVFAGKLLGKKVLIHEQNAYPGITNKITGRFADRIMISFEEASKFFKDQSKVVFTGNPIRREIININYNEARSYFGIKDDEYFIYSFGGSGGQKTINEAVLNLIEPLKDYKNIKWLHVTGKNHYKDFIKKIKDNNILLSDNMEIVEYMYEAPKALMAGDIIIGSAGAISIAEILYLGKPSILIPKKYTAENHQFYNAKEIEEKGAAVMILEKDLNSKILLKKVLEIINNKEKKEKMSKNSKKILNYDFKSNILKTLDELVGKDNNEK